MVLRSAVRLGTVAMLLLGGTACGDAPPDAGPRSPASKEAPGAVELVTPGPPERVVGQERWERAAIAIDNPDGLAAIDHAVFVKTDDGRVVRVDPRTARVVAETRVDTAHSRDHYCQGIGTDGDTLWACTASDTRTDVVRLDPRTLAVTARVRVDKVFDQYFLPVVDGALWVLSGDGSVLSRVDTRTGEVTRTALPERCFQLAATADTVYATCLLADVVLAVDARSGSVVGRADVLKPTNVAVGGGSVWVSGVAGLYRFDAASLEPLGGFAGLMAGPEGDLLADATGVWVRDPSSFLTHVDAGRGAIDVRCPISPVTSGGSLLDAYGALWTSASDDGTVYVVTHCS